MVDMSKWIDFSSPTSRSIRLGRYIWLYVSADEVRECAMELGVSYKELTDKQIRKWQLSKHSKNMVNPSSEQT